ncbi:MAG: DUF5691 domain-containing protein [Chloroflexota bacterium]
MSDWQTLTKRALLGTQRNEPTMESVSASDATQLSDLMQKATADSPELSLLLKAGILALHDINGRLPEQRHLHRPTLPTTDTRPVTPPHVIKYLNDVMYGKHILLLNNYLEYLNLAGYRIPPQYLPNLLDKGVKSVKSRAYILPILGNEGRWLATQNPVWDYAAPDLYTWSGLLRYWDKNEAVKRQQLLASLRQENPELGRKLLENYWRSLSDHARHSLIKILENNISMADEPFLEAALDDRSHLVRRKAAELLAFLPDSRLALRMANHVRFIVLWRQGQIKISFPKEIKPEMSRDGIQATDPKMDLSRLRSRQLTQMVSAVPLDYWTLEWNASIPQIIRAVAHCRFPRTMLNAFVTAARKQKNQEWIQALVIQNGFNTQVSRLVKVMDHDALQAYIQKNSKMFKTDRHYLKIDHPMMAVLKHHPQNWNEEMSQFWLTQFATYIKQTKDRKSVDMQIKSLLTKFFNGMPTSLDTTARDIFEPAIQFNEQWRPPLEQMFDRLTYRKQLITDVFDNESV